MFDFVTKCKAIVHYTHFEGSLRKVAAAYCVGKSTVGRWVKKTELKAAVKQQRQSLTRNVAPIVRSLIQTNPYLTCSEICSSIERDKGIKISRATAHRALKLCNLSYKLAMRSYDDHPKDSSHQFYHREDVYTDAISIDETCFYFNDMPLRGWGPRGIRVPKKYPVKRTKVSLLLAMDTDGIVRSEIIKGNFNSVSFAAFVAQLPRRRRLIMDNAAFHKANIVKEVTTARNMTVDYIPPYNPWYNPVEYAFSVVKNEFRKRRSRSRNLNVFEADAHASLTVLSDTMCTSFFDHAKRLWLTDRLNMEL
jgi:transposase